MAAEALGGVGQTVPQAPQLARSLLSAVSQPSALERLQSAKPSPQVPATQVAFMHAGVPLGVRQVLVHGTADPNVPYELGWRYYEAARALGDDVELLTLPEMGHFEVIDPYSDAWPTVLQAVAHLLT